MKLPKSDPAAEARLQALAPRGPDVAHRRMFGQAAVFVNGHMCLGTFGDQLFVRLDDEGRARAFAELGAKRFEPMPGRPMGEYVVLPEVVLSDRRAAGAWVRRSVAYVRTLPPKAATLPRPRRARKA